MTKKKAPVPPPKKEKTPNPGSKTDKKQAPAEKKSRKIVAPGAVEVNITGRTINPVTGLNPQQEKFCQEYAIDFEGKRAAIAAKYGIAGAAAQASRLLTDVNIQLRLKDLLRPAMDQYEVTQERIMKEVATIAFSNLGDYVQILADGSVLSDFSKVTREQFGALKSIKITEQAGSLEVDAEGNANHRECVKIEITTHDKLAALEKLMRRAGLIKEEIVMTHKLDEMSDKELARRLAYMLASGAKDLPKPEPAGD